MYHLKYHHSQDAGVCHMPIDKKVMVAAASIIVILLAVYLLSGKSPIGPVITSPLTASTTVVHVPNTTTLASTIATTASPTSTIQTSSCLSQSSVTYINNGFFAENYTGWNVTGLGFGASPFNISYANSNSNYYGSPWAGYDGGYFATTFHGGLILQPGNLTSAPFEAVQPFLNFQIISPQNSGLYVEILKNGRSVIKTYFNTYAAPSFGKSAGNATSTFVNATVPIAALLCKQIQIRVVAEVLGTLPTRTQYIAIGGFYTSRTASNMSKRIIVNQTVNQTLLS